jgi:hypothetical protein
LALAREHSFEKVSAISETELLMCVARWNHTNFCQISEIVVNHRPETELLAVDGPRSMSFLGWHWFNTVIVSEIYGIHLQSVSVVFLDSI